jgi:hypothetical protein
MAAVELTDRDIADLMEIQRLLDEAYTNYFDKGDGYSKSSEGWVEVGFGNFWERQERHTPTCNVYSYVFGPHRMHYFETIQAALRTVREWHAHELSRDYEAEAREEAEFWAAGSEAADLARANDDDSTEF